MKDPVTWAKGSLPNWLLVLLVTGLGWFCARAFNQLDIHAGILSVSATRLAVLESESKQLKDSIQDLRLSNRDILLELKSMNMQLRK